MRVLRHWSVRHARGLKQLYSGFEKVLLWFHPVFKRIGYQRLDGSFLAVEKLTKGALFDSQSCGQCVLGSTGLSCPMNCPKSMRNGPCGGVRSDGKCEVDPQMICVWVLAWDGNKQMTDKEYPIQIVQPPIDARLKNTSAWLRAVRSMKGATDIVK